MARQRASRSWAASSLFWGILLFAGSQLALVLVMERWRPELCDPEYGLKRSTLLARIEERPGQPLVLVRRYFSWPGLRRQWCGQQLQACFAHRAYLLSLFAPGWQPPECRLDAPWRTLDGWGWRVTQDDHGDAATFQRRMAGARQAL